MNVAKRQRETPVFIYGFIHLKVTYTGRLAYAGPRINAYESDKIIGSDKLAVVKEDGRIEEETSGTH